MYDIKNSMASDTVEKVGVESISGKKCTMNINSIWSGWKWKHRWYVLCKNK